MKKVLFAICIMGISMATQAQKTTFGIKGGLNLSTVTSDDDELSEDGKRLSTFHVGGIADIGISPSFSIQPQLLLQGKGISVSHEDHSDDFKFLSLDIPVNLLYKTKGFFIGGGPNVGINLNGKLHEENDTETIDFGSAANEIKRANLGVNALVGYQTRSGLLVSANYLADLTNWRNTAPTWRNNLIGISLGYMFGARK